MRVSFTQSWYRSFAAIALHLHLYGNRSVAAKRIDHLDARGILARCGILISAIVDSRASDYSYSSIVLKTRSQHIHESSEFTQIKNFTHRNEHKSSQFPIRYPQLLMQLIHLIMCSNVKQDNDFTIGFSILFN